ncbi:hypothetical protein G6N82_05990 [Altererythrobacter sp. BO-6]|nr:hypothetical protein G6N82_05990 [Altererythrobacter sp. BO-6]
MKLNRDDLHLLRQPLNVIRLAKGNMLRKIENDKNIDNKAYYISKLEIIEDQIDRLYSLMIKI